MRLSALAIAVILAVAVASSAAGAVKPRAGTYSGEVGTFRISLRVPKNRGEIIKLRTDYENTLCPGIPPSSDPETVEFAPMKLHGNSFSGSLFKGTEKVKGKFKSATEAVGTVSDRFKVNGNPEPCEGKAEFTVTLGGAGK